MTLREINISDLKIPRYKADSYGNFDNKDMELPSVLNCVLPKVKIYGVDLSTYYFEVLNESQDPWTADGMIVVFGNKVFIIDEENGFVWKKSLVSESAENPNEWVEFVNLSGFNYPGDNKDAATRVGILNDYMQDAFGINTDVFLEQEKDATNIDYFVRHIAKLFVLFTDDFRFNHEEEFDFENYAITFLAYLTKENEEDFKNFKKGLSMTNGNEVTVVDGDVKQPNPKVKVFRELDFSTKEDKYHNVFCFDYDGQKFMFKFITENRREPEFLFMTFKRNEWIKIHLDILEDEIKQIDPLLTKEQNIVVMKDKVYEAIEFFFMD